MAAKNTTTDRRKKLVAEMETAALWVLADLNNLIIQARRSGDVCPPAVLSGLRSCRRKLRRLAVEIGA